jgi:hypothetical protein
MRSRRVALNRALMVSMAVVLTGTPCVAQSGGSGGAMHSWQDDVPSELGYLGLNALVAGLAGGLAQAWQGGCFVCGLTRGALGGGIAFGGRLVAAEDFAGAGLLGRQVSAVGASLARQATRKDGELLLMLPIGPLHLHVAEGPEGWRVRPKVNGPSVLLSVGLMLDPRASIDWSESASSGVAVWDVPGPFLGRERYGGLAVASNLLLFGPAAAGRDPRVSAHERIHILQWDFAFSAWGAGAEEAALDALGLGAVSEYVDLSLTPAALVGLFHLVGVRQDQHFYEREAWAIIGDGG